jgi:hypothetical protein
LSAEPFYPTYSDCRVVVIPSDLDPENRKRFIARISDAVRQQLELSRECETVLRPAGEVREEGGRLIIPHERAAPANPAGIAQDETRPDAATLWWLSWVTAGAMQAAASRNLIHGGLQFGCVFRDETGRIKLGDFGIATAFEAVCGLDARRYVACDPKEAGAVGGRHTGGVWRLLDEHAQREHGWIAPYFGHELLEGRTRLNLKSDQFALGAMLFVWGAGTHPYGVELSDPNQMVYFQLEPYALEEERDDWEDAFERAHTGVQTSADQKIIDWRDLVTQLLAADPRERFESLDEAMEQIGKHAQHDAWSAAYAKIGKAMGRFDAGDVEAFLKAAAPLAGGDELPSLWRDQLRGFVQHAESQKEAIARRKQLEARLRDANSALEMQDTPKARDIAAKVADAPEADDAMREAAAAVLKLCDEHDELIRSGAAELARQNLEAARDAFERDDLPTARQHIELLQRDPSTPDSLRGQGEALLEEIEQSEQRVANYLSELTRATIERRDGKVEEAAARIEALLAEDLPESISQQARLLQSDIAEARERFSVHTETLAELEAALERADSEGAVGLLAKLVEKKMPKDLRARRAELAEQAEQLKSGLALQGQAQALFGQKKPSEAKKAAGQALGLAGIPQVLRSRLQEFQANCDAAVAELEKAALAAAVGSLEKARKHYENADVAKCRELLDGAVLTFGGLPDDARKSALALRESCEAVDAAAKALRDADRLDKERDYAGALAALETLSTNGLPPAIMDRANRLTEAVRARKDEHEREQRERLGKILADAQRAAEGGDVDKADRLLAETVDSPWIDDELRARAKTVRKHVLAARPWLDGLAAAQAALDQRNLADARRQLQALPSEPAWVKQRAAKIEAALAEAEAAERKAALKRGRDAVNEAQAAVDRLDPAAAAAILDKARDELKLDAELTARAEKVRAEAKTLEQWLSRLTPLEQALSSGDVAQAYRDGSALMKESGAPEPIARRVRELVEQAKKQITARQEAIKRELAEIASEIEQRQRRARHVPARLGAIAADALAAKSQKGEAAELLKQFEVLPPPKSMAVPIAIAAVALLAVGGGVYGFMHWNSGPKDNGDGNLNGNAVVVANTNVNEGPPPENLNGAPVDPGPLFASAQSELERRVRVAASAEYPDPPARGFDIEFRDGGDERELVATIEGRAAPLSIDVVNVAALQAEDIEPLYEKWTAILLPELKPAPVVVVPQADLASLRSQADGHVAAAFGDRHRPYRLTLADGQLVLHVDAAAEPTQTWPLAGVAPAEGWLDELATLVEMPQADKPTQEQIDDFAAQIARATRRSDIRITPSTPEQFASVEATLDDGAAGVPLVKFVGLRWTFNDGFDPPADKIAAHFAGQAAAIEALAAGSIRVALGGNRRDYEARLALSDAEADLTGVRPDGGVTLRVPARLAADTRGNATFQLSGLYAAGVLTADENAGKAFDDYLSALQKAKLPTAAPTFNGAAIPPALKLAAPTGEGDSVARVLGAPGGASVAALTYAWSPATLAYDLANEPEAIGQARKWMRAAATVEALREDWQAVREGVAPEAGQTGAQFARELAIKTVEPLDPAATDSPFTVNVRAVLAPADAAPTDAAAIPVTWRVVLGPDGKAVFDSDGGQSVSDQIARAVAALAGNDAFANAQADRAIAAFSASAQARDRQVDRAATPPTLSATLAEAGRERRIAWTWDRSRLAFIDPKELESAKGPAAMLAGLAGPNAVDPLAFGQALHEVTLAKCAAYNNDGGYVPAAPLAQSPADASTALDALLNVSRALQGQIAQYPERGEPYPLVFVEYYVEAGKAYGMAWTAQAGPDSKIAAVDRNSLRVWEAPLPPATDPASMLAFVTDPSTGDGLLAALPRQLAASADGVWGIVIAPAGPLWAVRWDEVRFTQRALVEPRIKFAGVTDTVNLQGCQQFGDLLTVTTRAGRAVVHARTGVWCVPSLGGVIPTGKRASLNSDLEGHRWFYQTGAFPFMVLRRTQGGNTRTWDSFVGGRTPAGKLNRVDIGWQFWTRDWSDGVVSFGVAQTPP